MRTVEELARIAALIALIEEPGIQGEALAKRVNELLDLGENGMREFARSLPGYSIH